MTRPKAMISILSYSLSLISTLTVNENTLYFNEIFQTTGSDRAR
jgi:ABC-type Na+ transport system ATPase subunit NatA